MIEYIPISEKLADEVLNIVTKQEKSKGATVRPLADGGCSCDGSCSGSCSGGCSGGCKGTCSGSCVGTCTGGCSGECTNACSGVCQTKCENGGQTLSTYNGTRKYTFNWSSNIGVDKTISITASEWNDFARKATSAANELGKPAVAVLVDSNDVIKATTINQVIRAINAIKSGSIAEVHSGELIEASKFIDMANKFNKAPIPNDSCCELGEPYSKGPQ